MNEEERIIIKCPECNRPYPRGKEMCGCCIAEMEEE